MKLDFVNLIPYISDRQYFWYQIFLISDISDTQYIWYPIYLIWYLIFSYTHISDTHIPDTPYFWYPIFQIPHISDTQYLLYPIFMIPEISDIRYFWYFWYMNLFLIPNRGHYYLISNFNLPKPFNTGIKVITLMGKSTYMFKFIEDY